MALGGSKNSEDGTDSRVDEILHAAVDSFGGDTRAGQFQMAHHVASSIRDGRHLLAQAGTGTGKSLAYLVPSLLHDDRVVVATATLNLQHQLIERDIPALKSAVDVGAEYAVVKGRANYACLHRIREGVPDDQGVLVDVPEGDMGAEVVRLRQWAGDELARDGAGDRESAPAHQDAAWRQISVSARECLGAQRCPYADECFAERARAVAEDAQLIVTNHSLLAIDAIDDVPMLPEYDVVIVDEAHELTARVTQASTEELGPGAIERAARKARRYARDTEADKLIDAADALTEALGRADIGRVHSLDNQLSDGLALIRDTARACISSFESDTDSADASREQARAMVDQIRTTAERMAAHSNTDVLWTSDFRGLRQLHIAPIDVSGQLSNKLFGAKTVVLTSATLKLGGQFDPMAESLGLTHQHHWDAIDVGSPFDYSRQAMLYVAADLPNPGRDGLASEHLNEISELVRASGGRALGLFSSRRAAQTAAEHLRTELPDIPLGCQGEAQLSELARQFTSTPDACLFGTLSLWQGIDIPGEACQLVIIDRIPFPRPDDPIMSARSQLVSQRGGNGFMQVSATHAALLLAQGSGRLIRRHDDRGVVAILDPRLVHARYGSFLASSLPAMWRTINRHTTLEALARLNDIKPAAAPR